MGLQAAPRTDAGDEVKVVEYREPEENRQGGGPSTEPLAPEVSPPEAAAAAPSIHSLTTEEWRKIYEPDGYVDLWVEEEFNAGSRLVVGSHSKSYKLH
jgi:hypothetical protein